MTTDSAPDRHPSGQNPAWDDPGILRPCPRSPEAAGALECLGSLTGRIAHDFNNLLCVMLANTELARFEAGHNRALLDYLDLVTLAGDRARDLVRQVLSLTRRQSDQRQPVQLAEVVRDVLKLLRFSVPPAVDIASFVEEGLAPIAGDATQLHQVVMNLCTNAFHAMSHGGGRLSVRLDHCTIAAESAEPKLPSGEYARLVVSDTGHGMDDDTRRRIFEPFFSTKPRGHGTGLGLTVVKGIVDDHGGTIRVSSQPGQGTAFTLYFPIVHPSA